VGELLDSGSSLLAAGDVDNRSERGVWQQWQLAVPGIASYRGQTIDLVIAGVNDSSAVTWWRVGDVQLVFACSALAAHLDAQDLPPAG
jgi:hypothetical protein